MDFENPQYIGQYDPKKNLRTVFFNRVFQHFSTCNTKQKPYKPLPHRSHRLALKIPPPVQGAQAHSIGGPNRCRAVSRTWKDFQTGNGKASNFMENTFIYIYIFIYTHHVLVYIYIFVLLLFQCSVSIICIICMMCIVSIVCITCIRSYSMYIYIYIVQIMYNVCIF